MTYYGLRMESSRKQVILENPSLNDAYRTVKHGISNRGTVLIAGNCWVDYEGRASSKLDTGERLVLFKSDGSAQVHRSRGYSPVNWQPPGSIFKTMFVDDRLVIRVFRRRENEVLEVTFDKVILVAVLDLMDSGEFYLYASEEDMKQALIIDPELLEEGFRPITAERPVEPGFIDILGRDRHNVLTVVEIKRKTATKEAVLQLKRYVDFFKVNENREIRGILVAPDLARGAQEILASLGLEYKLLSPKKCADVLKHKKDRRITDFIKDR